jgi:GLPGLI family protein
MNASIRDSIKNQTIIAWFALDIPVSAGPDRYTGLPGLILEININKGALVISAETITINQEPLVVEKPVYPKRVKLIKESDYYDLISKYIADSKKLERVYFWGLRY